MDTQRDYSANSDTNKKLEAIKEVYSQSHPALDELQRLIKQLSRAKILSPHWFSVLQELSDLASDIEVEALHQVWYGKN